MELFLYYSSKQAKHPIVLFTDFINQKYSLGLQFIRSNYENSSIGPLPVLQMRSLLFPSEQVVSVLCHISQIDAEESKEYLSSSELLKTLCLEKFHHLTNQAHSLLNTRVLWQVPLTRLGFTSNSTLKKREEVFVEIDSFHQVLNEILADNLFFYENLLMGRGPRSVDLVVFYCLQQELELLPQDSVFIKHSLKKYKFLLIFFEKMKILVKNPERPPKILYNLDTSFLTSRSLNLGQNLSRSSLGLQPLSLTTSLLLTTLFFYLTLNG